MQLELSLGLLPLRRRQQASQNSLSNSRNSSAFSKAQTEPKDKKIYTAGQTLKAHETK